VFVSPSMFKTMANQLIVHDFLSFGDCDWFFFERFIAQFDACD